MITNDILIAYKNRTCRICSKAGFVYKYPDSLFGKFIRKVCPNCCGTGIIPVPFSEIF